MKKTSKKLLSLFLAVVMIITSCSVGFTAFGADKESNSYWSDKADADSAFASLNDLADAYVPMLLNIDAIKKILEDNLGMTVTDETTISDVVAGASPLLLGLLGGKPNKAEIRGDSSVLADTYFSYLDDENAVMDFYSLYKFCKDNTNSSNEELKAYAVKTLAELDELLAVYKNAKAEFVKEQSDAENALKALVEEGLADDPVYQTFGDYNLLGLESFENSELLANKSIDDEDIAPIIKSNNAMFKTLGLDFEIKTVPEACFYILGMGNSFLSDLTYLGLITMNGAEVKYNGTTITSKNALDVFSEEYTYDDYLADQGVTIEDINNMGIEGLEGLFHAMYLYQVIEPMFASLLLPEGTPVSSPWFYEMTTNTLLYSGIYKSVDEIKAFNITDEQIESFVEYAQAHFNVAPEGAEISVNVNDFIAYINSDDCPFSEYVKEFIAYLFNSKKSQFVDFQGLATKGDIEGVKNFNFIFGNALDGNFIEGVNTMIPSVLLNKQVNSKSFDGMVNDVATSFTTLNIYFDNIADKTANSKYLYSEHAVPDSLTVEAVNSKLNGLLDEYLAPGAMIAGLIDVNAILNSLVESDIELYKGDGTGALDNLWLNLYNSPIETVFRLLPILDILVDELVVPLLLNGDNNDAPLLNLYTILTGDGGILQKMSQDAGPEKGIHVGIGALHFDLNTALPAVLHWITGDESFAYDVVGKYNSETTDKKYYENLKAYCDANVDEEGNRLTYDGGFNSIPKFVNIYAADKAIYKFKLSSLEGTFKKGGMDETLAKGLTEAITELATFARDAIDEYVDEHALDARYGVDYGADATITQRGLNNIMVALPQVLDNMGKLFIEKYNIDSDWTYLYEGKIVTIEKTFRDGTVTQLQNAVLQDFKDSGKVSADAVLGSFVNILIGNWINAILDLVNDMVADKNNTISTDLEIVNSLLNALGGFGEKSIVTDIVNGFFGLTRKDDASFTLKQNEVTGFNGFSNESGFFLLTNIQYDDNGTQKGIIPFVLSLINKGKEPQALSLADVLGESESNASFAPLLASSKSAAGTDYSKLLTKENVKAADELVSKLDKILSSLLKNTSINGFDLTSTDSILSAVISFVSNFIGQNETNELINLLDSYVECIVGENAEGPINPNKVYTSKNLSNLVVRTYSLVEAIADNLLNSIDSNGLIADAICGIVSPDSVGIRMNDDYSATKKVLLAGHTSWSEINDLKFDFSNGDKEAFYDALGESVNGVATVIGFLLGGISSADGKTFYSELVYPIFTNLADATGATGVMSVSAFNEATDAQKLIKGIVTPVSSILAKLYNKPATFIINLVQGLASIVDDAQLTSILDGVVAPINGTVDKTIDGVADLVSYLSPVLAGYLEELITGAIKDIFPLDLKKLLKLEDKDIIVNLINGILPENITAMVTLPSINWAKLAKAGTAGEALLLVYGYVVDTVLGSPLLTSLLDSLDENLASIIKNLSASQILQILNDVLDVATTPTEIYWTFSEYASKLTGSFSYPKDISKKDADKAVEQLDGLVENVFPLLETFGLDIGDGLSALVNDNLFTNENLTSLAKLLYGALDNAISSNATVGDVVNGIGFDFSTKGFASILMDKSYGATFSSASATLKKASSWDKVKSLNWGFKNGSKMAQQGFINGLVAILRPFDDIIAVLTADNALDIDFKELTATLTALVGSLEVSTELGEVGTLEIKNGVLTIVISGDKDSTIKVNLKSIIADALDALGSYSLRLGSNGYESAIVPLLEAFMIDDLKTYKEYVADIKKAKDNVLLDVLNPIVGLINDVLESPFGTIAGILPNLAYFIDNNGLTQAIGNLLAPILSEKGILGALAKNGINLDKILTAVLGKDLGSMVTDLLGVDVKLNIELMHLEKCNIQDIVMPLISGLLEGLVGIELPEVTFAQIASLGKLTTYKSAARNDKGNFTAQHVVADKGKVLIAVLRFVAQIFIDNASAIENLLTGIDAIANNKTISNVISSIFNQLKTASKDDIVRAIFYFLTENATDAYWNYKDYKEKDYAFDYGDIDADFMAKLAGIVDGSVEQIFALLKELNVADITSLQSLVDDNLYKNDLVAKLATGLYGAIEGVELGSIGSLSALLAKTDIDFTAKNVAKLLTDSKYGKTYPEVAKAIQKAGSWKKVKASDLDFKVNDRDSFLNALCAILRPVYGVLDVLFNDGALNIFNLVSIPGSNGYESTLVPILEALGVTGLKTMAELKGDAKKAYDNILLDVLVPVFDWLEDILDAPFETIASILPSVGLFIANDGLIQAINNLLTPVSALLNAIKPIVDINKLLDALGVNVNKLLGDLLKKANISVKLNVNVYDLPATLKPLIGQDNIVPLLNAVLGLIKVGGKPLAIKIPEIDWFKLASHGEYKTVPSSAKNTEGRYDRETVDAEIGETLLAVLRFVEDLLIDNADALSELLGGIDAIKKNKTILNVLNSVFANISKASLDDIVKAVLYFFEGRQTDKFFDFSEFTYNSSNDFAWGELDKEFCETLPPMLDGLVTGLLEEKGGLLGLIGGLIYKDDLVSKIATGLYGAIEGVKLGDLGSLTDILALVGIDFSTDNVASLLTDETYGTAYASNAAKIKSAGSWKKVSPESLSWGVTDRDSFVNALCAVLRPIYGVLDVLLNDGLLNLYDIVSVPGSDGYTSTIVPLLEAFSCYNVKTQYQYREDMAKEYDAILKDVLNPLLDKVEDLLNAPIETLASMLPNLSLFFANDGLLQVIDNLLTPVSALLGALQPILDVNELLDALGVDLNKLIAKAGLNLNINLDVYDLKATLKPLIGAENVVGLINNILGIIKIKGTPLGLVLPEIDWLKLASHGDVITNGSSAVATTGSRIYIVADSASQEAETLIAVLRFLVDTVNYKDNYNTIVDLIGGLIGGADSSITDVVGTILNLLKGDADTVILNLVDMLQQFA